MTLNSLITDKECLFFFVPTLYLGPVPLTSGVENVSKSIAASSVSSSLVFMVYLEGMCGNLQQQEQCLLGAV